MIPEFLIRNRERINQALATYLAHDRHGYSIAEEAMEYSTVLSGKRIRPCLVIEFCKACGGDSEKALAFGCGLEMIHTYSLIHDDLPCMDDDDLRRGQPSCHVKYGYANALLAGDALLTKSFGVVASADFEPSVTVQAVKVLSDLAGIDGMIGGQVMDLANEGKSVAYEDTVEVNRLKTGALLKAAARLGCLAGHGNDSQTEAAVLYAEKLGEAFQIVDDILDVIGDEQTLGKPIGSDADHEKATLVSKVGLKQAKDEAARLTDEAKSALKVFGDRAKNLCELADYLLSRNL